MLQIPFFIAFYTVLTVAIEMRGAKWLWVTDLSQPERFIRMLPLVMVISQFLMQKMTPPRPGRIRSSSASCYLMPLIMLIPVLFGVSSGLVLYWVTGNIVGVLQQMVFNRIMPNTAPAPAVIDVKP